jgi:hypothetical protein
MGTKFNEDFFTELRKDIRDIEKSFNDILNTSKKNIGVPMRKKIKRIVVELKELKKESLRVEKEFDL